MNGPMSRFSELKNYMYVTNSRVSNNLYFHVDELPERDYRFLIDLPDTGDRVIPRLHLYYLLKHFDLSMVKLSINRLKVLI